MTELSIVLPVFNEAENIPIVAGEVLAVIDQMSVPAEVLFVDDGSTDGSVDAVGVVMAKDPRVRLLRMKAHAGLTAAFDAGYANSTGRIVVTMDADLQNDPSDIGALLEALKTADAAVGWRVQRHDNWRRRVSSRIANAMRTRILGDDVIDSACSLRAVHRHCLEALLPYNGLHRFVPTLLRASGFHVTQVPVRHRARRFGSSKFGVSNRALRAFVDLLAVKWLLRRRLRYEVDEVPASKFRAIP